MKPLNQIKLVIHTTDEDFEKIKEKILKIKEFKKVWLDRWVYLNGK